jgi:hypothetical protein
MREYEAGQVWKATFGPTVSILKVEELPKFGKVVHVRVDNVPNGSCGSVQLTKSMEHFALTEKMVRKSALDLVKENADLPDSYLDVYREWGKQKKHEVLKVPIQDAILSVSTLPGLMICNLLPSRTTLAAALTSGRHLPSPTAFVAHRTSPF